MTESLDWVREHARLLQEYIENAPKNPGNLFIYRGLHAGWHSPVAVSLFVPYQSAPFAQVQAAYRGDGDASWKLTAGLYITATELAVFMGLGSVPPEELQWIRQVMVGVAMPPPRGAAPTLTPGQQKRYDEMAEHILSGGNGT